MNRLTVNWAYYGTMPNPETNQHKPVKEILQKLIDDSKTGLVKIDNHTMEGDPSPNHAKAFCASVSQDGVLEARIFVLDMPVNEGKEIKFF